MKNESAPGWGQQTPLPLPVNTLVGDEKHPDRLLVSHQNATFATDRNDSAGKLGIFIQHYRHSPRLRRKTFNTNQ